MSELQIALIAIGALIIVAVLFINWWQERRFHNQVENSFTSPKRDALLEEPNLDEATLSDRNHNGLNEPTFDTQNSYNISNDALADRESNQFSIDETLVNTRPQHEKNEHSDRFVRQTNENSAEILQEEVSIDDTYNELINTKLDKLSTYITADDQQSSKHNVDDIQAGNQKKAVNDELTQQHQNIPTLQKTTDNQTRIEPAISLPEILHGQIDLTALLYLSSDTAVGVLNDALGSLFNDFDKPVFVHVLDSNKQWHLLQDLVSNQEALSRLVSKIACSIQLADRGGAIERSSLNRFQLAVESFGLDVNGHVEWQDAGDALSVANSLDLFCIEVDKTIGFHLVNGEQGAFTGTKLRGLAEAQGLVLTADGTFKSFDQASNDINTNKQALIEAQAHPSFVMFNRDDYPFNPEMLRTSVVKGITFQLDIPHVKQSGETFNQMIQVARQMEKGLNAILVDDNNKVLGDIQIEKIRQQLKVLQASMLVRGIVPGSDSAHRLFS
jgi:FtsZ-interacting cell division protein ZipA